MRTACAIGDGIPSTFSAFFPLTTLFHVTLPPLPNGPLAGPGDSLCSPKESHQRKGIPGSAPLPRKLAAVTLRCSPRSAAAQLTDRFLSEGMVVDGSRDARMRTPWFDSARRNPDLGSAARRLPGAPRSSAPANWQAHEFNHRTRNSRHVAAALSVCYWSNSCRFAPRFSSPWKP